HAPTSTSTPPLPDALPISKIVDHAQRRTEIVHALWQVIYLSGIDAVSFRSVAEAAGISIGRVQHYFPSRRELVLEGCRQIAAGSDRKSTRLNSSPVSNSYA